MDLFTEPNNGIAKQNLFVDKKIKTELYNDNFQNYKRYNIKKAQLVIADIPYNLGINAYASNPMWYIDGDNKICTSAQSFLLRSLKKLGKLLR